MSEKEEIMNPTTINLEKIDAWISRLADETDMAAHGEEMTRYLTTLSRFWSYSARNCYLIALQRPDATHVASRKTWESLGRTVKTEEWRNAVQIVCPHFRKVRDTVTGEEKNVLTRFSTGYVYDVAQTEGRPFPELTWQQTPGYTDLYRWLFDVAWLMGRRVVELSDLPTHVHGWSDGQGTIAVSMRDTAGSRCQTLLHELAHELCHDMGARTTFTHQMLECQAEAISYCLCQALGLPTPNTPSYLALYQVDRVVLMENLEAIRAGIACVLREVERAIMVGTAAA